MVNQDATVGDPATSIAFTDVDGTAKVGLVRDPDTAVADNNSILDQMIQGEEQLLPPVMSLRKHWKISQPFVLPTVDQVRV